MIFRVPSFSYSPDFLVSHQCSHRLRCLLRWFEVSPDMAPVAIPIYWTDGPRKLRPSPWVGFQTCPPFFQDRFPFRQQCWPPGYSGKPGTSARHFRRYRFHFRVVVQPQTDGFSLNSRAFPSPLLRLNLAPLAVGMLCGFPHRPQLRQSQPAFRIHLMT